MSPEFDPPKPGAPDDNDLGAPAHQLVQLEVEPSTNFFPIVRRKIYRRTAASQFVNFTWNVPAMVLRELLAMGIDLIKEVGNKA
jgi:hypothetical protein